MMDFEELMKTAICEFSKKKFPHFIVKLRSGIHNKSYFLVYFYVIEQMTCLVIEQIEYRANDLIEQMAIEQMTIEQMEIEQMS